MSNRGRQNVASFLVLDLELDWRLGADWCAPHNSLSIPYARQPHGYSLGSCH